MAQPEEPRPSYRLKMVVVGDNAVGKTSLITAYVENKFARDYLPTLGTNVLIKDLEIGRARVQLAIFDVAGQERWQQFRAAYYQGTQVALVVADLTRRVTFVNVAKFWLPDLKKHAGDVPVLVLANKADLTREVNVETFKEQYVALGIEGMMETSALTGQGVDLAFRRVVESFMRRKGLVF
ncbi:MAG: Rab family GTPase [Promethearchaeota archaeon]